MQTIPEINHISQVPQTRHPTLVETSDLIPSISHLIACKKRSMDPAGAICPLQDQAGSWQTRAGSSPTYACTCTQRVRLGHRQSKFKDSLTSKCSALQLLTVFA